MDRDTGSSAELRASDMLEKARATLEAISAMREAEFEEEIRRRMPEGKGWLGRLFSDKTREDAIAGIRREPFGGAYRLLGLRQELAAMGIEALAIAAIRTAGGDALIRVGAEDLLAIEDFAKEPGDTVDPR